MKKFLLCFLSLLLIFTIIPVGAVTAENSESNPVITVEGVTAKQGETVDVSISIDNNPGIIAMAFCVSYNTDALEYMGYKEGYLTNYNIKNHIDKGWISSVNVEDTDLNNNNTMLTLTFKVKEETPLGKYEICILNNNPEKYGESLHNSFTDSSEDFIVPTVINGYIKVANILKGDVNSDGKINSRDAAVLMQFINGWSVTVIEEAADVNGDGKINSRDYALLMQYVNGWPVEFK